MLTSLKQSNLGKRDEFVHKRKRVKGPNPLSCKKKKVKDQSSAGDVRNSRKRTKKRSRKRAKTDVS